MSGLIEKLSNLNLILVFNSANSTESVTEVTTTATILSNRAIVLAVLRLLRSEITFAGVAACLGEQFSETGVVGTENVTERFKKFKLQLEEPVNVSISHSPENDKLSVQYAVMAVCKAAGVPYNWDRSAKMAEPERRQYIEPVNIEGNIASQVIADMIGPIGLLYSVDANGVYLTSRRRLL